MATKTPPDVRETRWTDLLWNVVEDYFENTTLHGYRYLTEPGRHWVERLIWLIVHVLAIWGVVFIIVDVWKEFLNTPLVTTVDSTHFPIWEVPFPAVAVCNLNKISLNSAKQMAKELSRDRSYSKVLEKLRYLGRLYDHDIEGKGHFSELHRLLQGNSSSYNVSNIMSKLSPSCDELLVRCMWMGRITNCSELFKMRKTMEGYCCAFNYVRDHDDFISGTAESDPDDDDDDEDNDSLKVSSPGYHMGLSVILNPNPRDYYYPLISSYGSKVLVFNPRDYPDTPSGGLIEKLVPLRSEVFFRLEATTVFSTEGVRGFSRSKRNCLFKSELSELFAGYYSYSECVMNCRIRSIKFLCQCVPFYFPTRGKTRECHMMDIDCLSRYREKWSTLRPTEDIPGLEMEREESIECRECLPSCSDTAYHVQTTSAPLMIPPYQRSMLLEGVTLQNHSVFHLFFGSFNSMRLKQDVLYYWYDLLSNFGGICGLFVGFSLISIIEFLYFFTIRLFFVCQRHNRREYEPPAVHQGTAGSTRGDIYWREILPGNMPRY